MLIPHYRLDTTWINPYPLQAVPRLPDIQAKLSYVARSTGKPLGLVRSVLDFDLQTPSRNRRLLAYEEVLRQVAGQEPQSWEPNTDPLFSLWGIRNALRAISLPRPDLQQRPIDRRSNGYRTMAARLLQNWDSNPLLRQIRSEIHPQIHGRSHKGTSLWQVRTTAAWLNLHAAASGTLQTTGPQARPSAYHPSMGWQDLSSRPSHAGGLRGGLRTVMGRPEAGWLEEATVCQCYFSRDREGKPTSARRRIRSYPAG